MRWFEVEDSMEAEVNWPVWNSRILVQQYLQILRCATHTPPSLLRMLLLFQPLNALLPIGSP